jgi:hypothetical protein
VALVDALENAGTDERHLVVAHSDTVPSIARALGVDLGEGDSLQEYDHAYLIEVRDAQLRKLRFRADGAGGFSPDPG